jgi:hypothetical protein
MASGSSSWFPQLLSLPPTVQTKLAKFQSDVKSTTVAGLQVGIRNFLNAKYTMVAGLQVGGYQIHHLRKHPNGI